jgi:hypothetical protein
MGYQGASYLRFYTVFAVGIEKMQLEVLFQFFENKLYRPSMTLPSPG